MKLVVKWFKKTDMRSVHKLINSHSPENGLRSWRIFLSLYKSIDKFPKFKNASILY